MATVIWFCQKAKVKNDDGNLTQTNNCSFVYNALSQSQNGAKYFISYLDTETLKLIALKMHFKSTIGISKAQSNNNIPPALFGKITDGWALNYKLIINASAGRHLSLYLFLLARYLKIKLILGCRYYNLWK